MPHALRGSVLAGKLSAPRADDVRVDFADLLLARYPHTPLADRAWGLRDNCTAYDAMFIALSEQLGAPLVTCDRRLVEIPGARASVEVYGL